MNKLLTHKITRTIHCNHLELAIIIKQAIQTPTHAIDNIMWLEGYK